MCVTNQKALAQHPSTCTQQHTYHGTGIGFALNLFLEYELKVVLEEHIGSD